MKVLIICVLIFQFSLINAYISWHNSDGPFYCQSDADCGNPHFVKCLNQGGWTRNGWGTCRIPWDFGKECNTDLDCYRGSHCHAIYCHGPSTRGPNPVLEPGLKKFDLNFHGFFPKFLRWVFRYCRCDPGTEQLYPGFRNAENNIESQKVMAVLNADTTDLIATRKRRSLERQSDALTSIMGYEKKKTCNSYSSKYFGHWAFSVGASFCPDDSIRIYKKIYVNFWKL